MSEGRDKTRAGKPVVDSLFYVEFGEFAGNSQKLKEEQLRLQFNQKLFENQAGELDVSRLKDEFIMEMPLDHQRAIDKIKHRIFSKEQSLGVSINQDLLVRILTSKCSLQAVNSAFSYIEKNNSYYISRYNLQTDSLKVIFNEFLKKIEDEKYKILENVVGDGNSQNSEIINLKLKFEKLETSEEVETVFNEEFSKLVAMSPMSQEFNTIKNYLETIASIPFKVHTEDDLDIRRVSRVLGESASNAR